MLVSVLTHCEWIAGGRGQQEGLERPLEPVERRRRTPVGLPALRGLIIDVSGAQVGTYQDGLLIG